MTTPKNQKIFRIVAWFALGALFLAANRSSYKRPSPYEVLVLEIKAKEGYRPTWYRDGSAIINGRWRPSYSIGLGWNDHGGTRRHEIKEFTADGKVTFDEALKIALREIDSYQIKEKDPYRAAAMKLYSYNCGKIKSGSLLGSCHGGSKVRGKRCGHKCNLDNKKGHKCRNVRKAHNERRELELALWTHNWPAIAEETEKNRNKVRNRLIEIRREGL